MLKLEKTLRDHDKMASGSLVVVAIVLRQQRGSGALQHLANAISSYLGPCPNLSLNQACAFGSIQLLDWIWDCSSTSATDRTPRWSLTNFLRSDLHYNRYQFAQSMKVAADRGDMEMAKWLFARFLGCVVPWGATAAAAGHGNLPMLQFLLAHDSEQQENEGEGSHKKRKIGPSDADASFYYGGNVIRWGKLALSYAKRQGHSHIVQWLLENFLEYREERDVEQEIRDALEDGNDALAKSLMPPGGCVLDYAEKCSRIDLIEMMLDCGYILRDRGCANSAIRRLSGEGRLDLMQQVVLLHSPTPEDQPLCLRAWYAAIRTACGKGYLAMLQWLMEHPLGQELCGRMRQQQRFSDLMGTAGRNGSAEVMQYFYDLWGVNEISQMENIGQYADVLVRAVRDERYNTTKWLVEHVRFPDQGRPADYIIEIAVRYGRFDILKLFHEMDSVIDLTNSEENYSGQVTAWWARSKDVVSTAAGGGRFEMLQWLLAHRPGKITPAAMNCAAINGHLDMVKWLDANGSEGCITFAMDQTAMWGHLEIVKWLHSNQTEGCTSAAMDNAASRGHLELVRWLQNNRSEGCTTKAMDGAARNGHLNMIKWLYANRSEGCTVNAIKYVVENGHVSVANWLFAHFPQFTPRHVDITLEMTNLFEMFLFVHEHFPHVMTQELVYKTQRMLGGFRDKVDVIAWLGEKYQRL